MTVTHPGEGSLHISLHVTHYKRNPNADNKHEIEGCIVGHDRTIKSIIAYINFGLSKTEILTCQENFEGGVQG
jgi:hypothetical protein